MPPGEPDGREPAEEILAEVQDDDTDDVPEPVALGTLLRAALATIESGKTPEAIETPFRELNELLDGGFRKQELALVAAKTAALVDLLIVDYLQLVSAPKKIRDRRLQVEHVNRVLRRLAIRFNVAVVCVSSLRRLVKDETPSLDSLRESGDLEYGADVVIVLSREFQKRETSCRVLKQRNGQVGEVALIFEWEYVRFQEG